MQVVTFQIRVTVPVVEGVKELQLNGLVRKKDSGDKEKRKVENQRRKWTGKRKVELSS